MKSAYNTLKIKPPTSVRHTPPTPPKSDVPPTTTAAIVLNSKNEPSLSGSAVELCAAYSTPDTPARKPLTAYTTNLNAVGLHAGEPRRAFVSADGKYVAAGNRSAQSDGNDGVHDERQDDRNRYAADERERTELSRREAAENFVGEIEHRVARDEQREPARGDHDGERHDDRLNPRARHDRAGKCADERGRENR